MVLGDQRERERSLYRHRASYPQGKIGQRATVPTLHSLDTRRLDAYPSALIFGGSTCCFVPRS